MADTASQQFTKLPSSSKILLLAVLLALIGAGYYSLLHGPLNEEIDGIVGQKAQLEDQLRASKDLQARFLKLREELEQRKTEYMLREESGDGAPRRPSSRQVPQQAVQTQRKVSDPHAGRVDRRLSRPRAQSCHRHCRREGARIYRQSS